MRLFRIITALVVGLAVAGAPAAAEAAQPYPPGLPNLTTNSPTVEIDQQITLFGDNYRPGETVEITVGIAPDGIPGRRFTVVADGDGSFRLTYQPTHTGEHRHVAIGQSSHRRAEAVVKVVPDGALTTPGDGDGGNLPVTGDGLGTRIAVGAGLLGLGSLLVVLAVAWRRRSVRRFGAA